MARSGRKGRSAVLFMTGTVSLSAGHHNNSSQESSGCEMIKSCCLQSRPLSRLTAGSHHKAMTNTDFSIPEDRFDNGEFIERRVSSTPVQVHGAVRTALLYLYSSSGPKNLPRERLKLAEPFVEAREKVLLRWLQTRTNGSLRATYGEKALIAARNSRYRCTGCGFSDVRALQIDHVDGRKKETAFACLCANCHCIKSRAKDWSGTRKQA